MAAAVDSRPAADIGVFGGSGLYTFLEDADHVALDSEWGSPSAPVTIGAVGGVTVAFLPRHGTSHHLPPHKVDYRANVAVMRRLGVRALLAPFAAGSLQPDVKPGEFMVVDQLVDRTSGRVETFHDDFSDGPRHVSLADPYDADLREVLVAAGRSYGLTVHDHGTVVVVNGPRFSTRAESQWFGRMGWDLVNMTQHPEAALAREAGIPYAGIGVVTDYDAGLAGRPDIPPVSQEAVFERFAQSIDALRTLLRDTITHWADDVSPAPTRRRSTPR